MPSFIAAAIV